MTTVSKGNYDKAYELLSSEDQDFLKDFKELKNFVKAFEETPSNIEEVEVTGEKAQFLVTFYFPESARMRMRAVENPYSEIEPLPKLYDLVKEKDGWRVYMGWKNEELKAKEKQAYFPNIEIRNVKTGGMSLGRNNFVHGEIKNKGDKSVKWVEVRAYCLDKDGKAVFDFKVDLPVFSTLKPNYSWSFSNTLNGTLSDWSGEVRFEVTDLEFE